MAELEKEVTSTPAAAGQPSEATEPQTAPAAASGQEASSSVAAGQAPEAAPSGAPAPTEYEGVRDAMRNYGMDVSGQFDNDHAALQNLVMQARQLQELRQQVVPHWDQFRSWQQQEQARQQEEAAKKNQWWKPPEWDPAWRGMVQKNPQTGALEPVPGAPAGIVEKYLNAQQHMQGFLEKFSMNPMEAIKPGLQQMIQEEAQKLVQQQMGGYQQQQSVQSFIQEHTGWLHEKDAQGQNIINPVTRAPQLSVWGQQFANYVREADSMGMPLQGQQNYALAAVQRDYAVAQMKAASPAAQNADKKETFLEKAEERAKAKPATPGKQTTPDQPKGRLEERLRKAYKENGFQLAQEVKVGRGD